MTDNRSLIQLATDLGETLQQRHWRVVTAESCTGGGVAAAITAIPGSSAWFEYGLVTYADAAKQHLLGVDGRTLVKEGAVSESVVRQMAAGALSLSGADIAVAVSGIAGPSGGSAAKPVGTVWFAWEIAKGPYSVQCHHLEGERNKVQQQAVVIALEGLLVLLNENPKKPE
ncbi:CinA family protein [Cellvibrio sp. ARAG 10.3]|uniref:CinA family protein n=1 Tax=Cellvibrio sp. ARAG 10.3 TaxID=3451358 RepID=UPI003F48B41C